MPDFESHISMQSRLMEKLGGRYLRGYITKEEERQFIEAVDADESKWMKDLKRRVQHYGYRYDYQARRIDENMKIEPLPKWADSFAERLGEEFLGKTPDQMIVNEYEPGQGIAAHVDCEPCFGAVVVSVSLGASCMMEFAPRDDGDKRISVFLEPCSAIILKDASRYSWTHAILPRKKDSLDMQNYIRMANFLNEEYNDDSFLTAQDSYPRGRRVSLTFRTVIVD